MDIFFCKKKFIIRINNISVNDGLIKESKLFITNPYKEKNKL